MSDKRKPKFEIGDRVTSITRILDATRSTAGPEMAPIEGIQKRGESFGYNVKGIGSLTEESAYTLAEAKEYAMKELLKKVQNTAQWPTEEYTDA